MSSSREDKDFVAETLGAFGLEVVLATADFFFHKISEEEYVQLSREHLKKYGKVLLDWKGQYDEYK